MNFTPNILLYPFKQNQFEVKENNNIYKMNYVDEGNGQLFFLVHGTPDWSFSYREQIKVFSNKFNVIANDHLGFGLSDKSEILDYSIENQSKRFSQFANSILKSKNQEKFNILLHDFGCPIGLQFVFDNIEKLDKIYIVNTWLGDISDNKQIRQGYNLFKGFIGKYLYLNYGFSTKVMAANSYYDKSKFTSDIKLHLDSVLDNKISRLATHKYLLELVEAKSYLSSLEKQINKLENKEVHLIWGENDKFFQKDPFLSKWQNKVPKAKTFLIPNSGHFPHEEQYEIFNNYVKSTFD